jgi:hypothetical protein
MDDILSLLLHSRQLHLQLKLVIKVDFNNVNIIINKSEFDKKDNFLEYNKLDIKYA